MHFVTKLSLSIIIIKIMYISFYIRALCMCTRQENSPSVYPVFFCFLLFPFSILNKRMEILSKIM